MADLNSAAEEIFEIMQSFDYTVLMYGEEGNRVEEPAKARHFFDKEENLMVWLKDDGDNSSINLYKSKRTDVHSVLGIRNTLATAATNFNLLFHFETTGANKITPKIFSSGTVKESRYKGGPSMKVFEGLYGTSRSSYLKLENARMIVRHSAKIDETKFGARGRCIESIFVENEQGERFLMPPVLSAGRAMTQHLNHSGGFADAVGAQILRMANDYQNLGQASRHVATHQAELPESAMTVREACRSKMKNLRKTFEKMFRPSGYQIESARIMEMSNALIEGDADKNVIDADKLDEVRQTLQLEGIELDEGLFETVYRAVYEAEADAAEAPVEAPAKPAKPKPETYNIFGREVSKEAFDALKHGHIELSHKFRLDAEDMPRFRTIEDEIRYKFAQVARFVRNDSLANLCMFVDQRLSGESDARSGHDENERNQYRRSDASNPAVFRNMMRLAVAVLKAAGVTITRPPQNNPAVRGIHEWFSQFTVTKALREFETPRHMMGDNPHDTDMSSRDSIVDGFDIDDFVASLIDDHGFDPHSLDVEDRVISRPRLLDAIESRLQDDYGEDAPYSLMDEAKQLVDEVAAKLENEGVTVEGDIGEDDVPDDDAEEEFLGEEPMPEDVLLPSDNMDRSLKREVTKPTVRDPETGKEQQPDDGHISRLRQLSGLTTPSPLTTY